MVFFCVHFYVYVLWENAVAPKGEGVQGHRKLAHRNVLPKKGKKISRFLLIFSMQCGIILLRKTFFCRVEKKQGKSISGKVKER